MKYLWRSYNEIEKKNHLLAHCNESLDEHGNRCLIQLDFVYDYLGDLPLFSLFNTNDFNSCERVKDIISELTYFHDLGKINPEFQKKLLLNCKGKNVKLPQHSEVGFKMVVEHIYPECEEDQENKYLALAYLLSTIIDRHHSDLKNVADFKNINLNVINFLNENCNFRLKSYFLYRIAYSCLKTSDILSVICGDKKLKENIITPQKLEVYEKKLESYLQSIKSNNKISSYREKFRNIVINKANTLFNDNNSNKRIIFIYLPTGGGKTLTSLNLALNIAKVKNCKRIFYVFPYINIIEQNSLVMKNVFGDDLKAIHTYSDPFEISEEDIEDYDNGAFISTEVLNFPAVVMSSVRLFDILYSNKKSAVSKTWALANSIFVIDEVQYIPKRYWELFIETLAEFGKMFNCYFILMSATLPKLDGFLNPNEIEELVANVVTRDDIEAEVKWFESRNRISILDVKEPVKKEIVNKVNELSHSYKKILVVVNTINLSREIYETLKSQINSELYILNSTLLYPRRLEILEALSKNGPKVLISTQSIEAGVDLDFEVGIREKAPLESIAQVMGRINRELKDGEYHLFVTNKSDSLRSVYREINMSRIENNMYDLKCKSLSEVIDEYFESLIDELKKGNKSVTLKKYMEDLYFERVSKAKIIDEQFIDVFYDGTIILKNSYRIGKNELLLHKRIEPVLNDETFKSAFETKENTIIIKTRKFMECYDTFVRNLNKEPYDTRFNKLNYLKTLNFIMSLFCFPLRSYQHQLTKILEKDSKNRYWINSNYFSFEEGIKLIDSSAEYIW